MRIGYFEKFKGRDVILISGSSKDLDQLAARLGGLATPGAPPVPIHECVQNRATVRLTAYLSTRDLEIRGTSDRKDFEWSMTSEGWLETAERIMAIARNLGPAHTSFESRRSHVDVFISTGEYDEDWWAKHGEGGPAASA